MATTTKNKNLLGQLIFDRTMSKPTFGCVIEELTYGDHKAYGIEWISEGDVYSSVGYLGYEGVIERMKDLQGYMK